MTLGNKRIMYSFCAIWQLGDIEQKCQVYDSFVFDGNVRGAYIPGALNFGLGRDVRRSAERQNSGLKNCFCESNV